MVVLVVGTFLAASGVSAFQTRSTNLIPAGSSLPSRTSPPSPPSIVSSTVVLSQTPFYLSDIPRDDAPDDVVGPDAPPPPPDDGGRGGPPANSKVGRNKVDNNPSFLKLLLEPERWRENFLPPPPEDQFIMTGDLFVLFFYAYSSHSINDAIVESVLRSSDSVQMAVRALDPAGALVTMQNPVWVQTQNQPAVDHALVVTAQEAFLNHWGPLFSTEGSAAVALCTCWMLAGWLHRAFLFQNSVHCRADEALQKTLETWVTTAVLVGGLAVGTNAVVHHVPFLQTLLCVNCRGDGGGASFLSLTKADGMFIVDSMSVLIAWRFIANRMLNTFR